MNQKIKQMRYNGRSNQSKLEIILKQAAEESKLSEPIDYSSISDAQKDNIVFHFFIECNTALIS